MALTWTYFLICALLVLFFGIKLARYGDIIAEKTGLSSFWIGLFFLAVITSLPEIITGISAVAVVKAPDLAVGTLFGSNAFNLSVIALLDVAHRPGALLASASLNHTLSAGLGVLLIVVAAAGIFLSTTVWDATVSWLSIYSVVLIVLYLLAGRWIYQRERTAAASHEHELMKQTFKYEKVSRRRAYIGFSIAALGIIGTGTWLAIVGNQIATVTGLSGTFVGTLLLAFTTSLPEVVVALAALRIGAVDMAIADVLGSNLFNIGIGMAFFDAFSGATSIFAAASLDHLVTAAGVALMSIIVVIALVFRSRRKTFLIASWYAPLLIAIYVAVAYFLFSSGLG